MPTLNPNLRPIKGALILASTPSLETELCIYCLLPIVLKLFMFSVRLYFSSSGIELKSAAPFAVPLRVP